MERILMALQGLWHFKDISQALGACYGEVFGQAEYDKYEMPRYYLDDVDIPPPEPCWRPTSQGATDG